jgi:hypothetical protein
MRDDAGGPLGRLFPYTLFSLPPRWEEFMARPSECHLEPLDASLTSQLGDI